MPKYSVHLIAAARPNFMKVAPLYRALARSADFDVKLVHTGQHYDANMSAHFFVDLGLPDPDFDLGVGSGTHAEQIGRTMMAYEPVCVREAPSCVVVVGDVNATAAVAMVCAKLGVPLVHLEAGLRSGDRTMPEEVNRIVTDTLAQLLWTHSADADQNLAAEGVKPGLIERVGNIMIDSLEMMRESIEASHYRERLGLAPGTYGMVTLHRPANVDERATLGTLVDTLVSASERLTLVFPIHPRTHARLHETGLYERLVTAPGIRVLDPLRYVDFMNLTVSARVVITDSGGLQEETTYLGIPCITLRPNTERPITVSLGTNRLARPEQLLAMMDTLFKGEWPRGQRPLLWDGHTAKRCSQSLRRFLDAVSMRG